MASAMQPAKILRLVRRRAVVLRALLAVTLAVLVGRLWQLQVVRGASLYAAALNQSLRVIPIPAPRGEILDSRGRVLATDAPAFAATLSWTKTPPSPAEVALLSQILGESPRSIEGAVQTLRQKNPYVPVVLRSGLTPQQYTLLVEDASQLPGVSVIAQPIREYPGIPGDKNPGPDLAANILGYVIKGKNPVDVTGGDGVELSMNGLIHLPDGQTILGLQGIDGKAYVEVNSNYHPVRTVALQAPVPGNTVVLTIHAGLQAVAQRALSDQMAFLRTHVIPSEGGPYPQANAGAVVVMDVNNGQVLAMASEPAFNPNAFAQAASALPGSPQLAAFDRQYGAWLANPGRPLVDHAISDVAPIGSTFKPVTAIAALQSHVITPSEHIACPPQLPLGGGYVLHNWIPVFDGYLDLTEAIAFSCDTYFYQVGAKTGIAAIDRVARAFGFGQLTGQHALYGEDPGQISGPSALPPGAGPWTPALTMQTAIGQAYLLANPLQVADYVAALANGGTLWRPYFVKAIDSPAGKVLLRYSPRVRRRIPLAPSIVQAIHQAMAGVMERNPAWYRDGAYEDWGTAYWPFYQFRQETQQYLGHMITVAGKTGTAQVVPGVHSDGWFISFAPVNHPQIAVVVFVHHAGEGFASGAPVVREIYDYYFGLDRAMWKAGKADQIIPPAAAVYFGERNQIPDWWPPQPPASAGSRAPRLQPRLLVPPTPAAAG